VPRPRVNKPTNPPSSKIKLTASLYDISSFSEPLLTSFDNAPVCFVVLITRKLFEDISLTQDAASPQAADLAKNRSKSSSLETNGRFSLRKLYVKNL